MAPKRRQRIRGSGGGGSPPQPRIPVEAQDSVHSHAWLRIDDLVSEGEIVGLVDGEKSIYLDETPLQNEDGTYNFEGVYYWERTGTQDQSYVPGFSSVEHEIAVGVEVKYGESGTDGAIVRQITNPNVNRVRVRIVIPQLTRTDSGTGDINGYTVTARVDVQPSGGIYATAVSRTITGKSSSRYEFMLIAELTGLGPWNIRVLRETSDATSSYVQNKTFFSSYTEIIDGKLRYPNSAHIAMKIDAKQFQNVPRRYYDVKLLKIRVPSNYDPETREYTGSWDGTFQTAWSDNPSWIFFDLVTNDRYGLGAFLPEDQVDKWALYEIAQYADEMVDDGFGGEEPRFTCNLMLADRSEAYNVLQSLASVFRGMIYWAAGAVTVSQDAPQDAAYLYTPANVVDGRFVYHGASAKARHSVALVSWNDPEDFYRPKVEYVEDQTAIARLGIQQTEIVAFGCTSRGQAHRLGKWLLYTEQQESETVTFQTGLDGIVGRPGQVIKVADPSRAGARMGGRISSATTTQVTVDQDIAGAISGNTLSVLLPDGTVEDRTVTGSAGRVIEVQPAFSQAPNAQSVWVLRSAEIEPQTFRVISVKEEDGGVFSITALRHDPDKFDAVEEGLVLEPRSYSNLREIPDRPQNVVVSESLYQSASEVRAKISVSWDQVEFAVAYVVRYRRDNDNFIEMPEVSSNEQEILDVRPGDYTIQVSAVNAVGKRSPVTELTQEIFGKTAPPQDVEGFSLIPNAGQAYLTWTQSVDLDVLVGGRVRIRHTPRTSSQSWNDAIDIVPAVPGNATSAIAPLLTGTYMVKFEDSSGNFSSSETLIVTTVPYALALNVVHTETEHPAFAGDKTDMTVDTLENALVLASGTLVDDYGLVDDIISWDFPGGITEEGTYNFANTVDLSGVWPCRIISTIDLEAFDISNLIDQRLDNVDDWDDIDGDAIDDVNAELFVRTTEDDPSGSPTWTDWKRISTGEYPARGFEFQLRATSGQSNHNLYIRELAVTIDMADRAVNFGPLTSGTDPGGYHVDYDEDFYAEPAIAVTANNMSSGDYYTITNADEGGFDIVFRNSGGSIVSRVFSVIAKGYGRRVA